MLAGPDRRHRRNVTGPEAFTLAEAAETMARITGRPIRYEEESVEEAWASRRPSGAPDWEIEGWVSSYTAIAAGELDVLTGTVRQLAGHDPVRLEDYVRSHPESIAHVSR